MASRPFPGSRVLLLCLLGAAATASAQCYRFSGGGATLQIDITSILLQSGPTPDGQGGFFTSIAFSSMNTFRLGGSTLTSQAMDDGVGLVSYKAAVGDNSDYTYIKLTVPTNQPDTISDSYSWFLSLTGVGNRIPAGVLPPALTPFSAWVYPDPSLTQVIGVTSGPLANQSTTYFQISSITSCNSGSTINGKAIGNPIDVPGDCGCGTGGDPVSLRTGNLFEQFTDYTTAGPNKLGFTRSYNSLAPSNSIATDLGPNWRTNYDRFLGIASPASTIAERADGQQVTFTLNGNSWTTDSDVDLQLTNSGNTWTLTDSTDTVETYTAAGGATVALLQTIQARNGYTQTLQYDVNNALTSVTDSYGRRLNFTYQNGLLQSASTPDGLALSYGYTSGALTTAGYSTSPPTSQSYIYGENSAPATALTGLIDENGNRYSTWTYDSSGRVLTLQHAGATGLITITYNDSNGSRTVSNALNETETFKFTTLQGVPKLTEVDRSATPSTPAGSRLFTFDSNGYPASSTDWNGNLTTYVNDVRGQPATIIEAAGTPLGRTAAITYHQKFHLPTQIVIPGLTTNFTYDANGEVLTSTLTDTTSNTAPYSTNGQTRTWTYTWASALPASVKGPRTDVAQITNYTYDASGALTGITDPLGHAVQVTKHLPGGLPQTIIDANGVTRNLAYDERQRLISNTVVTGAGSLTTAFTYDSAGDRTGITLPAGAGITETYDAAHRLTGLSDVAPGAGPGNRITYVLDALGDRTQVSVSNSSGSLQLQRSATYDVLGRIQEAIGGASQATSFTYDANGNRTGITDPLSRTTRQSFDALNRPTLRTDPANGKVTTSYDANSRPLAVTDANGAATSYTYDGFGDAIQYVGARGTVSAQYDAAGNLIQKIDGRGVVANYTYDALNRMTSISYPLNSAENVTFTYDQPGHGFGVGFLTSLTDAAGTLSRTYDERGNLLTETRTRSSATLVASYTYDKDSNLASVTYPSQWTVSYTRDKQDRITAASAAAPGGGAPKPVFANAAYAPFGPLSGLSYGNGLTESRTFDRDYRPNTINVHGNSAVQSLTYGYDAGNDVLSIGDGVVTANGQNFTYDSLRRLAGASGAYGALTYSYDANGNRLTDASAATSLDALGTANLYAYNQAGRLAGVSANGQPVTQYSYDAFGERLSKTGAAGALTLYQYDSAGRLLEQADSQGDFQVDYIYLDDRPIAAIQASTGSIYFLHADSLGTPQMATDGSQSIAWDGRYQPFGATGSLPATLVENLRLPGQEFDQETGLYFNGFRPYVPGWGRYLQSDPIGLGGGMNTYAYANGNPLTFTDPLGLVSAKEVVEALKEGIQEQLVESGVLHSQPVEELKSDYGEAVDYTVSVIMSVGPKLAESLPKVLAGAEAVPGPGIILGLFLDLLPDFAIKATTPHEDLTGIGEEIDQLNALRQAQTSCTASNPQGQLPINFTPPPRAIPPDPYHAVLTAR